MPMPSLARMRDLDARAWSTATWSAPFIVQLVLAALVIMMWLLTKWPFTTDRAYPGEACTLTATVITTLVSLAISGVLLTSPSSRRRGLSLSIAGSSAAVFIGGVIWALWVYR